MDISHNINNLSRAARVILEDMEKPTPTAGIQCSWDWEADWRFANDMDLSKEAEDLRKLLKSEAPFYHQIIFHHTFCRKVKQRRLRALRELVRNGLVRAIWGGTGQNGKLDFGINRNRIYLITERQINS